MNDLDIQDIEIRLFLESVAMRYQLDFRDYAEASLKRRVLKCFKSSGLRTISEMIPEVLYNKKFLDRFLKDMSVSVTEMFRDPEIFKVIRHSVLSQFKNYPTIKIWHAGCATGEEAYSMSILLNELNLLDRSTIYATDYNNESLKHAQKGIFSASHIKDYTKKYQDSGGKRSFSEYYHAQYDAGILQEHLKQKIVFAHHNLSKDKEFTDCHLIFCRNVLIYFNLELQNKVLELFDRSLATGGFLILGKGDRMMHKILKNKYLPYQGHQDILVKKASDE